MVPLFIVGATASGKSSVALAVARLRGAWILSMDSMQVYRGLDIGTAKPTLSERQEIVHGGLDLVEPTQPFDVARYLIEARLFLEKAKQAGVPLIVVGGTGLYYRAITAGLAKIPEIPEEVQKNIEQLNLQELQERLKSKDPLAWARVDQRNPRRLIRALSVIEFTGKSLIEWQKQNEPPLISKGRAVWICRNPEESRQRIINRVQEMLQSGWIDEVKQLHKIWGAESVRGLSAIGYRLLLEWVEQGESPESLGAVRREIEAQTWQYARRQLTWFRREPSLHKVDIDYMNEERLPEMLGDVWAE